MIVALEWPRAAADAGHAFEEIAQRHGDFAIAAAACQLRIDGSERLVALSLGLGGVESRPVARRRRRSSSVGLLRGVAPALAEHAAASVDPMEDHSASAQFRIALTRTLVERVVAKGDRSTRSGVGSACNDDASPRCRATSSGRADAERPAPVGARRAAHAAVRFSPPRVASLRRSCRLRARRLRGLHGHGRRARRAQLHPICGAGGWRRHRQRRGLGGAWHAQCNCSSAFATHHALQCGFCTPGILCSATHFLKKNPSPDEAAGP